jgi:hypothetical protein
MPSPFSNCYKERTYPTNTVIFRKHPVKRSTLRRAMVVCGKLC